MLICPLLSFPLLPCILSPQLLNSLWIYWFIFVAFIYLFKCKWTVFILFTWAGKQTADLLVSGRPCSAFWPTVARQTAAYNDTWPLDLLSEKCFIQTVSFMMLKFNAVTVCCVFFQRTFFFWKPKTLKIPPSMASSARPGENTPIAQLLQETEI